jgi:hypothetical protein
LRNARKSRGEEEEEEEEKTSSIPTAVGPFLLQMLIQP